MYAFRLNKKEYEVFKAVARGIMQENKMSIHDLAKQTGYSKQSMYNFFGSKGNSRFVAFAIARELGIRRSDLK